MNLNMILKTVEAGLKIGGRLAIKHLPTILTAVGTVGVVAGTVMAAKKAPEAHEELQAVKDEWNGLEDKEKRSKSDYIFKLVRVGTRYYGIVALVVGGSVVCFWVANHLNLKRLGAALAAAKISADYAKDLEEQIKKDGGENKLTKMRDEINIEKMRQKPIDIDTSGINHLFAECPVWDPITKHWMVSSADRIRKAKRMAEEELRQQLKEGSAYAFVPYSDFLDWCGMDISGPYIQDDGGSYLGFAVEALNGIKPDRIDELVENAVGVEWTVDSKDGDIPVLALKYVNPPKYQIWAI